MLLFLLLSACTPKQQQTNPTSEAFPLQETMPTSPLLYRNTLPNGLTYFIHENPTPADRAELRLVIRAGSVLEADDQRGLAHFVEHMAFNGSENFPSTSLVQHMETLGMRFGAHLNAYTSFDETVYQLTVPTDDMNILETSFLILRDQAFHLQFSPEEIEKERGVVIEEWRGGLGASTRLQDELYSDIFAGAPYQDRFPIGTEESLQTFSHDALTKFYHDWYRPELMAIIAVGDFNRDEVEALIRKNFSDEQNEADAPVRNDIEIPDHDEAFYRVVRDAEIPSVQLRIMDQYNGRENSTFGGYKDFIAQNILLGIINERFGVFSQEPDAIFNGANVGHTRFNRNEESMVLSASLQAEHISAGLDFIVSELERIRQHGVLETELTRAKQEVMSNYEQYKLGEDTLSSQMKTDELIRAFLNDEPVPGTELEYQMAKYFIPLITTEYLNEKASKFLERGSFVVQLLGPERDGVDIPSKEDVMQKFQSVKNKQFTPYEEHQVSDAPLVDNITPGSIVDKQYNPLLNMHTWTLSNGAVVHVKSTEIKQDEVLLSAFSPGGLSTVSDELFPSASVAVTLKNRSGLGSLKPTDLEKKLSGIDLSIANSTERYFEEFSGAATPEHLDVLMELMYLQMKEPRFEEFALKTLKRDQYAEIAKRSNNPMYPVQEAFLDLLWETNPRVAPWDAESIEKIQLSQAQEFYLQKFGNARDFTFLIVGKMELLEVENYVETYIASLPSIESKETPQEDGIAFRTGTHSRTVYAGNEPKASFMRMFHGNFPELTWSDRRALNAMQNIVNTRLLKKLREEMSGVYSVSFSLDYQDAFPTQFTARLNFGCEPDRLPDLVEAAQKELKRMKDEPITEEELNTEKEQGRREREQYEASNHFWISAIEGALKRGEDPLSILEYQERNEALSIEQIQKLSASFFEHTAGELTLIQYPLSSKPAEE